MSIFTTIKHSVVRALNEYDVTGIAPVITLECKTYPGYALNWFYRAGAFSIDGENVTKERTKKGYKYTIPIKSFDLDNDVFKWSYVRGRRKVDTDDGLALYRNKEESSKRFEHLALEDNVNFELFLGMKYGFDNYKHYQLFIDKYPNLAVDSEEFEEFARDFIENRDYAENYLY